MSDDRPVDVSLTPKQLHTLLDDIGWRGVDAEGFRGKLRLIGLDPRTDTFAGRLVVEDNHTAPSGDIE